MNAVDSSPAGWLDKLSEMRRVADKMSENAKAAPTASKQQLLSSLVKQCEMLNSGFYKAGSWNALMKVYAMAKAVSMADEPSLKDLKKAVSELTSALGALETADPAEEDGEMRDGLPVIMKSGNADGSAASVGSATAQAGAAVAIDVSL